MLAVDGVHSQSVCLDRRQMGAAGNDGNLGPGSVQPGGNVAADRAGAIDTDLHERAPGMELYPTPGRGGGSRLVGRRVLA